MLLREKDRKTIITLAKTTFKQPSKILAYGSRVTGEAHDTSDLDMVVVSKDGGKIDIEDLINFKEKLQDSNIPILTQVLDWNRIPEGFHKNILENCEELVRVEG
ncbi:MAG: nucleotidyltransferase domain-containing protein [Campylobacterales bacterium]|nr:nucleotidyltransferase domain-containing protein [Campylobacterales bacterium]